MDSSRGTWEAWSLVKALLIGNADVQMGSYRSCVWHNTSTVGLGIAVGRFDLASSTLNASLKSTALGLENTLHISLMRPDGCF